MTSTATNKPTTLISLPPVFPSGHLVHLPVRTSFITYEDSGITSDSARLPVIYCLPGIGDFRHSYRFLAPKLQKDGFRVICQDLRGVGDSGTGFKSYNIEDCASDVVAVLDHEQINKVIIIGNSLSAAVAVTVAAEHPSRVQAIITTGGFFRDQPSDAYFRPMTHLLFNHLWGQPMWSTAYRSFFKMPPADLDSYMSAVKQKMLSNCDHASVLGYMIRATKVHAWSKIGSVKSPVLLMTGSKDPDFTDPIAEMDLIAENLTGSSKVNKAVITDVGHYPHVEKVDDTYAAISEFLKVVV
ncbi:hypothetical protein HDU76_010054 [Blyttiomyces sp. JEL0837]|nr:hypothetical protein HDU76_010054 [Blyttiomyces sp. JEL0837]